MMEEVSTSAVMLERARGPAAAALRRARPGPSAHAILTTLHKVYKGAVSPFFGNVCRFEPTCSDYALGALCTHGLLKGGWMTAKRLMRCHPFHPGGYDPVPPRDRRSDEGDA